MWLVQGLLFSSDKMPIHAPFGVTALLAQKPQEYTDFTWV